MATGRQRRVLMRMGVVCSPPAGILDIYLSVARLTEGPRRCSNATQEQMQYVHCAASPAFCLSVGDGIGRALAVMHADKLILQPM